MAKATGNGRRRTPGRHVSTPGRRVTPASTADPGSLSVVGVRISHPDRIIFPIRMNAGIVALFGNLGQDFVDSFESVSLNFSTMTFSSGAPRRIQ